MNRDKAEKKLGIETIAEMEAMSEESLKQVIVEANTSMKSVQDDLNANPKYLQLKEDLSAVTQAKKDVNSRQKARIGYALTLLGDQGKV